MGLDPRRRLDILSIAALAGVTFIHPSSVRVVTTHQLGFTPKEKEAARRATREQRNKRRG